MKHDPLVNPPEVIVRENMPLGELAARIRQEHHSVRRYGQFSVEAAYRAGALLAREHDRLKAQKRWLGWLETIGISRQTAHNYLIIYQRWAECQTVGHMGVRGVLNFLRTGKTGEEEGENPAEEPDTEPEPEADADVDLDIDADADVPEDDVTAPDPDNDVEEPSEAGPEEADYTEEHDNVVDERTPEEVKPKEVSPEQAEQSRRLEYILKYGTSKDQQDISSRKMSIDEKYEQLVKRHRPKPDEESTIREWKERIQTIKNMLNLNPSNLRSMDDRRYEPLRRFRNALRSKDISENDTREMRAALQGLIGRCEELIAMMSVKD